MTAMTAVVTGAGRGFGRVVAAALVAEGTRVLGVARTEADLAAAREELGNGFVPVVGDAGDEELAERLVREERPALLVLNAGARPLLAPLHEQSWESFTVNWNVDTRQAFVWTRAALRAPLAPGSVVVEMSSGAALKGSPLSGGYAGANAAVRTIGAYAADESARAGLGIRFVTLLPQLTPTGVGAEAVDGYAARAGLDRETFLANMEPILTPELVAKAVLQVASDPDSAAEYAVTGAGLKPLG
ncbi:SDR family oxidoreductase [Streptacidiphilus jiangxiensis]|uniref:NADP-dependent 3-hydroxy acid dehydrogenase YdfG n=1 Tax=Streptacidiphilus jiangxiensis TaxID=235985 RepID=A0A1H7VQQ4_STRJI|nr:SDR family oxidoreductase [Streptacidiphilus jiangxiensis]SEM11219.1 NADP-dependent 3-hydroxy acid dehydrogenase YdfG [Streptacidiphilus jiangxiensis]